MVDTVFYSCSTQDKAILEAAYNANPKPDKAARLDIVKRVSLNEKEVQVSLGSSYALSLSGREELTRSCLSRSGFRTVARMTAENRVHFPLKRLPLFDMAVGCSPYRQSLCTSVLNREWSSLARRVGMLG